MDRHISQRFLLTAAILMMLSSIFISGFTLWYLTSNKNSLNIELQNSLKTELAKYKFPEQTPITVDDAKLYISVAKYCEAHNKCAGKDGADSNVPGPQGETIVGPQGLASTIPGPKGDVGQGTQGPIGPQGDAGPEGRTLEQRCHVVTPTKRRIEQKYTDTDTWEVLYYLSPAQRCPEEIE